MSGKPAADQTKAIDDVLVMASGDSGGFAEPGSLMQSEKSFLSTQVHRTSGLRQEQDGEAGEKDKKEGQNGGDAASVVLFPASDAGILPSSGSSSCSATSAESQSAEVASGRAGDSIASLDGSSSALSAAEPPSSTSGVAAELAARLQRLRVLTKLCHQLLSNGDATSSSSSSTNDQLPVRSQPIRSSASYQSSLPAMLAAYELSSGYTATDAHKTSTVDGSSVTETALADAAATVTVAELLSVMAAMEAQLEVYIGCSGDTIQTAATLSLDLASRDSRDLLDLRQRPSTTDYSVSVGEADDETLPGVEGDSQPLVGSDASGGEHSSLLQRLLELERSHASVLADRDRLAAELTAARSTCSELEAELGQVHDEYQAQVMQAQRKMAAEMQVNWEAAQRRAAEEKKADVEQIRLQLERRYQAAYIEELRKTQKKFNDDLDALNRRYTEGTLHQLSTPAVLGVSQSLAVADSDSSEGQSHVAADDVDVGGPDGLIRTLTLRQQELENANRSLSKELEAAHRQNEVMSEDLIALRSENETITLQLSRPTRSSRSGSSSKDSHLTLTIPPPGVAANAGTIGGAAAVVAAVESVGGSPAAAALTVADGNIPPGYHAADCSGPLGPSCCSPGMGTFVAESPSQEDVFGVRSLLNSAHHELFNRMQQHWGKVHAEELVQLDADRRTLPFSLDVMRSMCIEYKYEIHVQLESLRAVMQQTYNGQIELLRSSYSDEADRRVADAVQRLGAEHQKELDDLEASWARRFEQAVAEAAALRSAAGAVAAETSAAALAAVSEEPSGLSGEPGSTGHLSPSLALRRHSEGSPTPESGSACVIVSSPAAAVIMPLTTEQSSAMVGDTLTAAAAAVNNVEDVAGVNSADEQQCQQQQQRQQRSDSAASMVSTGSLTAGAGHRRQRSNGGSGYEEDFEDWGMEEAVLADDILSPRRFPGGGSSPLCAAGDAASAALRDRDYFKRAATLTVISDLDSESDESTPRDGTRPPVNGDYGKLKVVERPPGVGDCCRRALAAAIAERQSHVERAERERDRVWQARLDALTRAREAELEAYKFRPDSTDELLRHQPTNGAASSASSADASFEVRAVQASLRKNGVTCGRTSTAAVLDEDGSQRVQELIGSQTDDLLRRAEPLLDTDEARELKTRLEDRQAAAEMPLLRQSAAEAEEKYRLELLAIRELHEREMESLKREHVAALRQAGQEWQDRMDDALHAASLDSERLAEELDSWKSKAMAMATEPDAAYVSRSSTTVLRDSAVLEAEGAGTDDATGQAVHKNGQLPKETIAGWRQSMTELMAEQEAIRRENADGLDQLRGTYEDQLGSLQRAVEQLLGEVADKDDTILKLTVRLNAVDTVGEQKALTGAAMQSAEYEAVRGAVGTGQNGRRVVELTELVRQLQDDVQRLMAERDAAVEGSEKLHRLLASAVQQQRSTGECITKHLGCGGGSVDEADGPRLPPPQQQQRLHNGVGGHGGLRDCSTPKDERMAPLGAAAAAASHHSRGSTPRGRRGPGASDANLDKSFDTVASDEGLDLSQHKMNDSFWALLDLDDDGDDIVADAGRSLQSSVDRLLEVLEQTRRQLAEARVSRDELLSELLSSSAAASHPQAAAERTRVEALAAAAAAAEQAAAALSTERDELAERLAREASSHQRLVLELQNAEGMLNGYIADRAKHEDALIEVCEARDQLESQCSMLRARVQMLEEQRADADAAQRLAERQSEAVAAAVGQDEAAAVLLRQNTQLDREKHEMSRQYERDHRRLLDRIRELEQRSEDVSRANDDLLEQSQTDKHDLELQLDALDRQLRASKQFIEEQTHEREAEREEYQRDAKKHQLVVEEKKRLEAAVGKLQNQVADLEAQLQDLDGSGSESGRSPRYRRGSAAGDGSNSPRTIQIDELKKVVRYLEVKLETKSSEESELRERLVTMEADLVALAGLNGDLEAELKHRRQQEARSSSESAAILEELQELATANAAQLASLRQERDALTAELERQRIADEELTHENNALRKQVNELLLQESALKSKLDSLKPGGGKVHGSAVSAVDGSGMPMSSGRVLHERLIACEETLEKRTAQVAELAEQLAYERERAAATVDELSAESRQAAVLLEQTEARHAAQVGELQSLLQATRDDSRSVHAELDVFKGLSTQSIPPYAQRIIAEKNEEVDHLNAQIAQLSELLKESTTAKLEKEAAEMRVLLQKKDDAIQEKEEELFTVTEELTALQHQLEAIQGGNSFAQEEAAAQQLQLEEAVTDLQQQLAAATLALEEAKASQERAASEERQAEQRRLEEMHAAHAAELCTVRNAEAERWQAEVAAARQASEGVISQLRALLDEKETIMRRAEVALSEAEAARQALTLSKQSDMAISVDKLQKQLEEKDRLLADKEDLVQAANKERLRLASARSAMEEELGWHRMELQEKDKLMSLLQLQIEQRSRQHAELQAQLGAAADELERERAAIASEKLSRGERLAAVELELQAERERTRASDERATAEADRRLASLESELHETRLQLAAASAAAAAASAASREMQAAEAAAAAKGKADISLEQEQWQARLEQERSDHEARVRELQASHRATLAATVDEVKQNLKKAYRRHLATVLKSRLLPEQDRSPTDRRQSPTGAERGSDSAVQQLLNQALVQGTEILALSLSPSSSTDRGKSASAQLHGHGTAEAPEGVDSARDGAAADAELDRLEERVQSLAARQAAAVDALLAADRRSLLSEVRELRTHLELSRAQHDATASRLGDELDEAVRRAASRERQLQLQLQLVEQRSAQEKAALHDARSDLEAERQSGAQLRELLAAERSRGASLAGDIRALESEVGRLEQTVEWRDKQLAGLRQAMEEERHEHREQVAELRRREQRALDELQRLSGPHQRLAAEHSRVVQDLEATIELLKRDVASEKDRCGLATAQAEAERQRAVDFRIRLEDAAAELRRTEVKYGSLATDLQQQLEDERAACRSLTSCLEDERQRCVQLQNELAAAGTASDDEKAESIAEEASSLRQQAEQLRALLEKERRRCTELQSALEREMGRSAVASVAAEADRRRLVGELQEERGASAQLKKALDTTEAQCHESTKRALRDGENIKQLSNELDRMRSRVNLLQSELEVAKQQQHYRSDGKGRQDPAGTGVRTDGGLNAGDAPLPASASLLLGGSSTAESAIFDSISAAQHRATTPRAPSTEDRRRPLGDSDVTPSGDAVAAFRQQLEVLRARLRRATLRLQGGTVAEAGDATAATDLRQIADELQRLHGDAAASIERRGATPASLLSAASLDEVLRHNTELARFVAKLSNEKADLRQALANLEEEIWQYRQRSKAEGESSYVTAGPQPRSAAAGAAAAPTSGEQRLRERLQRTQAAWLRAESLRKALVFQKRYLLLLLGGFEECEVATLQAVSRMAASPPGSSVTPKAGSRTRSQRGINRFRSAAYAIAAIRRMKILVSKWHRSAKALATDVASLGPQDTAAIGSDYRQPPARQPSPTVRHLGRSAGTVDADDQRRFLVNGSASAVGTRPLGDSARYNHVVASKHSDSCRLRRTGRRQLIADDDDDRHSGSDSVDSAGDGRGSRGGRSSAGLNGYRDTASPRTDRVGRAATSGVHNGYSASRRDIDGSRDGGSVGGRSSVATDDSTCFRPAMLSASRLHEPPTSGYARRLPDVRSPAPSGTPANALSRPPSVDTEVRGGSGRWPLASSFLPQEQQHKRRTSAVVGGRNSYLGDVGRSRSPPDRTSRADDSNDRQRWLTMPAVGDGRSPTAAATATDDDDDGGDGQSVDSQYLSRLESVQQQLARDLLLH